MTPMRAARRCGEHRTRAQEGHVRHENEQRARAACSALTGRSSTTRPRGATSLGAQTGARLLPRSRPAPYGAVRLE